MKYEIYLSVLLSVADSEDCLFDDSKNWQLIYVECLSSANGTTSDSDSIVDVVRDIYGLLVKVRCALSA